MDNWHYIQVKPVTKGRPRLGRRRKAYTPAKTQAFEAAIAEAYQAAQLEHHGAQFLSVSVEIDRDGFWLLIEPLETSNRPVGVTGDVDNYVKAILDGLNTVAYNDDKQVEQFDVKLIGFPRKTKVTA